MTKYYFDISGVLDYLRKSPRFTGIQRVVVSLADAACQQLRPEQAYISYLDSKSGTYYAIPYSEFGPGTLTDPDLLRAAFAVSGPRRRYTLGDSLEKYKNRPVRGAYHEMRLRLYAKMGRRRYRHLPRGADQKQIEEAQSSLSMRRAFDDIAQAGDKVVVMDAIWGYLRLHAQLKSFKRRGIEVFTMLHDLIPVVRPHFVNDDVLYAFEPWLRETQEYTSCYLVVSDSTGRDLRAFLDAHQIERPVKVVPLAQTVLPTNRTAKPSADAPLNALPSALASKRIRALMAHPYVLCAGTLEIRKNVWQIAQAWERLTRLPGLDLPKLVFVGHRGWMIQDFERMMEATGNLNGWIEVIEDADDAELAVLYSNSLFTITASFYEGWGLPIGESLAYGKTAVVSRASSMPEVGGDLVEYCDPHSIESILAACLKLIKDPDNRKALEAAISRTRLRQWEDVSEELLAALDGPAS